MFNRRSFIRGAGALMLGATLPTVAFTQDGTPRRVLFGYPRGGVGTELGEGITKLLVAHGGEEYRFDHVEGRNTRLATEQAKQAGPDGRTLLMVNSSSFTLLPSVYKDIRYDPLTDFVPIALLGRYAFSLTVGPVVPKSVTTLDGFLDWVMHNGEFRNVGAAIYGSMGHLAIKILARDKGVPLRAQPYTGPHSMIDDLHNGTLAAAFTAPGNAAGGRHSDALRTIGVTASSRLPYWPQVPTLIEQGAPHLDMGGWFGLFAPAGTSAAFVEQLQVQLRTVSGDPAFVTLQRNLLLSGIELNPQAIREDIRLERDRFAQMASFYDIKKLD